MNLLIVSNKFKGNEFTCIHLEQKNVVRIKIIGCQYDAVSFRIFECISICHSYDNLWTRGINQINISNIKRNGMKSLAYLTKIQPEIKVDLNMLDINEGSMGYETFTKLDNIATVLDVQDLSFYTKSTILADKKLKCRFTYCGKGYSDLSVVDKNYSEHDSGKLISFCYITLFINNKPLQHYSQNGENELHYYLYVDTIIET